MKSRAALEKIEKNYAGRVRFVYRHFPLSMHPNGIPAAAASIAANNQGKFWEYHDLLFDNYKKINEELIVKLAEQISLDMKMFNRDRRSDRTIKMIENDISDGKKLGIRGTPVFFINGEMVEGAVPYSQFEKVIEQQLSLGAQK